MYKAAPCGCGQVREKATGMSGGVGGAGVEGELSYVHCCEKLSANILLKADKQNDGKGVKANALGC